MQDLTPAQSPLPSDRVPPDTRTPNQTFADDLTRDYINVQRHDAGNALAFGDLRSLNAERCPLFKHTLTDWSALEWAGAMCGEAGEAANVCKKIKRLEQGCMVRIEGMTRESLVGDLAKELADIIIYADLLAAREGINLGLAVMEKFNEVSARVGYTKRLGPELPIPPSAPTI